MDLLGAIVVVFFWCFFGFIAMGVLSALWVESYTFDHWQKVKNPMRTSAILLGPLLFLPMICYMLYAATVTAIRDRMSIWSLPDWILAGFNEPPKKPKESEPFESPTVSP
jgi:hypothetical protein